MSNTSTLRKILTELELILNEQRYCEPDLMKSFCESLRNEFSDLLDLDIDFKAVVDAIDDSILIADDSSTVIYVNPNYKNNTGISPNQILGKKVSDIVAEGKIFTGGAVMEVLRTKKKAFRLSSVRVSNPPQTGYVVGVPLFDADGNVKQVVASSRPIFSLQSLQEDFEKFLQEANALRKQQGNAQIVNCAAPPSPDTSLIGNSSALKEISKKIEAVAPSNAAILITGESGVGKEIIANEIYRHSSRSDKPFVKVNCASIPLNLLESELFGYEKGAFSGANAAGKKGLFEIANDGTILLDEIGDMPLELQAKLLRAIQNKEITRVGGTKTIQLNVRFISATNSNLREKIKEGLFRQDLFYRLNVIPIVIPPLRERKEDIEPLCEYFIQRYGAEQNSHLKLSASNFKVLKSYDWPGNVRELENVIEYLTICSAPDGIVNNSLLEGIIDIKQDDFFTFDTPLTLDEAVANFERQLIESVLQSSHSLRDAGAKLGVNASTVSRKIRQYNIKYPHAR